MLFWRYLGLDNLQYKGHLAEIKSLNNIPRVVYLIDTSFMPKKRTANQMVNKPNENTRQHIYTR